MIPTEVKNPAVLIRVIRGCLLLGLLGVGTVAASELTIVRVFTGWRDAGSFKRISEYFDGRENTGGQVVLRTHPEERGGYYFLVRVANPGATRPVKLTLDVVAAATPRLRSFAFAADLGAGESVINLGLTGVDWTDRKADPVAWKLTILSAGNQPLAVEKSYLWEKPAGN